MKRMTGRPLLAAVLLAGGLGATALVVHAVAGQQTDQTAASALESVLLDVQGMDSLMCEIGVKSALEGVEGVTRVAVDRKAAGAEVTFDPGKVAPEAFVAALGAIGYRASLKPSIAGETTRGATGSAPQPVHAAVLSKLKPEQIETVSTFIAEHLLRTQEIPSGAEIERATGTELSTADTPLLQKAVLAKLAGDPRGQKLLAGSRCTDYGACSLWGNLATATGETLALYEREKASDGTTYADLALPAFEARNLAGEKVRSLNLVGRPAVLALLAVHCNHSMDTFPILQEIHRRHAQNGLQVVGVLVNSGSVEDANGWVPHFAPEYAMWVYEDEALGDLVGSHLVPTYLLVDSAGYVRKKIVGFKNLDTLLRDMELIASSSTVKAAYSDRKGSPMTTTKSATTGAEVQNLEPLFSAELHPLSDSEADAVVPAEGREGAYIGTSRGTVRGERLKGTIRASFYSANCLYPLIRKGQKVPADLHLCTVNPGGVIETEDGARIRFDGKGYGLRSPERYRVSMTMAFGTEDARYGWLTKVLGVMEGELEEKTGRSTWDVYVPAR